MLRWPLPARRSPEQETALGLHVAGEDMFDPAHERIDEYMRIAWHDAIDTMLGQPIAPGAIDGASHQP